VIGAAAAHGAHGVQESFGRPATTTALDKDTCRGETALRSTTLAGFYQIA